MACRFDWCPPRWPSHAWRNTFCVIFWYKSCASFFDEPDSGTIVFPHSPSLICVARSPLGVFQVAIPTQSHHERPRLCSRKTMYRRPIRHVSQRGKIKQERKNLLFLYNSLTINILHNIAENRVFPPNRFVVAANDVDSNIDCCQNSHRAPISPPYFPNRSLDRDKSPPHGPRPRNSMEWLGTG